MKRMAENCMVEEREEHKKLATIIKNIHADLRRKVRSRDGDFESVWQQHCQDQTVLDLYAESMRTLAERHWTKNTHTRIHWCRDVLAEYFHHGGLLKVLEKEEKRRKRREVLVGKGHPSTPGEERFLASGEAKDGGCEAASKAKTLEFDSWATKTAPAWTAEINREMKTKTTSSEGGSGSSKAGAERSQPDARSQEANEELADRKDVTTYRDVSRASCGKLLDTADPSLPAPSSARGVHLPVTDRCQGDQNDGGGKSAATVDSDVPADEDDTACAVKVQLPVPGKIRLLDVGSCYNPFLDFPEILAVGIDISPATESVHRCDFLGLQTTGRGPGEEGVDEFLRALQSPVTSLPAASFHVVVFCLLLEYLPHARQRWDCCRQARRLLMTNGLLVVVTPDSHSQHRNAPMMRSWRRAIEALGFSRWRYVKLDHLHCMAFRKTGSIDSVPARDRSVDSAQRSEGLGPAHPPGMPSTSPSAGDHGVGSGCTPVLTPTHVLSPGSEGDRPPQTMEGDHSPLLVDGEQTTGSEWWNLMYIPQDLSGAKEEEVEGEPRGQGFEGEEARQQFFSAVTSELPDFLYSDEED